jgi:hypothetical protein
MATTGPTLLALVRIEIGETTASYWTDAQLYQYLSNAAKKFSIDTGILLAPPKKCTSAANTAMYLVPSNCPGPHAIVTVFYGSTELDATTPYGIVRGDGEPHTTDTDTPASWYVLVDGGKVYLVLFPTPGSAVTGGIKVWFWKIASDVTALTTACDIPDNYVMAVVNGAAKEALEAKSDPKFKIFERKYDEDVARAKAFVRAMIQAGKQNRNAEATKHRGLW